MRKLLLLTLFAIGLLGACTTAHAPDALPSRLAAANLLAGSLVIGVTQAAADGAIAPGSDTAIALLVTLDVVELALDGAGNAWRAGLTGLAKSNLDAAEHQMAALQPLLPLATEGGQ